jgi:dUTP pyrophosphatase
VEPLHLTIEKLSQNASIPNYGTPYSAGLDLTAVNTKVYNPPDSGITKLEEGEVIELEEGDILTVLPGQTHIVGTGLKMAIPKRHFGMVVPRSGMALKGLVVVNTPGIIDSDYRGEIKILLKNIGSVPQIYGAFARIAQLILVPYQQVQIVEGNPEETDRGEGGFGSTGT